MLLFECGVVRTLVEVPNRVGSSYILYLNSNPRIGFTSLA